MIKISMELFRYTFFALLGFSLMNPAWTADSTAQAEINTGVKVSNKAPSCPPFGVGDTWTMRRTNTMAAGLSSNAEFTVTIIRANGSTIIKESVEPGGAIIQSELRKKKGMFYPVKDTVGNIEIDYVSNTAFCPPPNIGQSIVGHGKMGGMQVGQQTTTVTAINPNYIEVSVPAGTFKTRKIVTQIKASGPQASPPYTITHYYADGIGSVKEVFNFADGSTQLHELIAYKF